MKYIIFFLSCLLFIPYVGFAQNISEQEPSVEIVKARVVEIIEEVPVDVQFQNGRDYTVQTIQAVLLEGDFKGKQITVEQDYLRLSKGDNFLVEEYLEEGQNPQYRLVDFDRRGGLSWLLVGFMVLILVFAKWQGLRSLVSLAASLLIIVYILIPLLLNGAPPILTSVIIATFILAVAIFFTHGFNRRSLIAFSGTVITVFITGILASLVVSGTHLTGFGSHESTYLDFNSNIQLDFVGLLLAGIIIGVLGVLDDISITQVAVVRELYSANKNFNRWDVFSRALRVGKEHVSALVNTLVLAYVGVGLPLILYVSTLGVSDVGLVLNSEVFATEIVRTIIGSIGLILSVPLTTFFAVVFLENSKGEPLTEKEKHEGCAHAH
jgi:uncharacterized membrane protein